MTHRRRWWGAGVAALLALCAACSRRSREESAGAPAAKMAAAPGQGLAEGGGAKDKAKPGEVTSWKRSTVASNAARLMVGETEQLPLQGVEARVLVEGFRARVVFDYHFYNDKGRQLEGTLQLRLPEEASPYMFAFGETKLEAPDGVKASFFTLARAKGATGEPASEMAARADLWNHPREARVVPREKASHAYGETVRKRVDPALVEWQGAGVFTARVYPLSPSHHHRIVFGYDTDLVRLGDDLELKVELPPEVPASAVTLTVRGAQGEVAVNPAIRPESDGQARHYRFDNPEGGAITVRLKKPPVTALIDESARPEAMFAVSVKPPLPAASGRRDAGPPPTSPRGLFLVDTSLSANPDGYNVWLKLLRSILDSNRPGLKQFAVMFFNIEGSWFRPGFIDNTPENVARLLEHAESLSLEGATDLGAALEQAARPPFAPPGPGGAAEADRPKYDVFLLSDGAATWGESEAHALSRKLDGAPIGALFAYQTGMAGTDLAQLSHLARETGGAVFSVTGEAEVAAASVAHNRRPFRLRGLKVEGASDLMVAGRPTAVFPGQTLTVVGRGVPGPKAQVELELEQGSATQTVRVPIEQRLGSSLAARTYGSVAVAQLEEFLPETEREARGYAAHFRVTGRSSSLLMLESERDYERFGLKPQDDEATVAGAKAAERVARAWRRVGEVLGDPKVAFLAQLKALEATPGLTFTAPPALLEVVEKLPPSAFAVTVPPLIALHPQRTGTPGSYLELLSLHKLEYDLVQTEAARRLAAHGPADALRALSSLVEESPGDAVLSRDVGYAALGFGLGGQAYHLFRRVTAARPAEPLNYQAMARSLAASGNADLAMLYYEIALAGRWDGRFGDLPAIIDLDYLRLLRRVTSGELKTSLPEHAAARLSELSARTPFKDADLVVMIGWNTDNTDVDLHVIEPSGEECYYSHRETKSGGQLTRDVTRGYGPEMYALRKARPGKYQIRAKYFASDANRMTARTKVHATVIRKWGSPDEKITEKVVTLEVGKQMHDIDEVEM